MYSATTSFIPPILCQIIPHSLSLSQITFISSNNIPFRHIKSNPYIIIIKTLVASCRIHTICSTSTICYPKSLNTTEHIIVQRLIVPFLPRTKRSFSHCHKRRQSTTLSPYKCVSIPITVSLRIPCLPTRPRPLVIIILYNLCHQGMSTIKHFHLCIFKGCRFLTFTLRPQTIDSH